MIDFKKFIDKVYSLVSPLFTHPKKHLKTWLVILGVLVASWALVFFLKSPEVARASWPSTAQDWLKRKQLTLVNNSGQTLPANTTYSLTINTKELYEAGDLSSGCEDIRVYYQPNANTATKLNYYVEVPAGLTCATSNATTLHFPLQAELGSGSQDSNYYLYFKNPSAQSESTIAAFNIGSKEATFYCGFKGGTGCVNQSGSVSPTTESGAIRYSGSKSALSFNSSNNSLNLGSNPSIDNLHQNSFTVESYYKINFTEGHSYPILIDKNGFSSSGWWIYTNKSTKYLVVQVFCSTQNGSAVSVNNVLTENTWHHIAFTFDNNGDRKPHIFVDGSEVSYNGTPTACQGTYVDDSSRTLYINNVQKGKVVVDEFRISNTVRYTSNFTPQTTPFVRDEFTKLLLHFDENGDDPRNAGKAIDDSGNGNHGTITGAKYVAGLVGVDSSTTDTGQVSNQAYGSHQGVFLEEGTTNKITNPSFEHSTYNTGWSIGTGATASENTTAPYYKFGSKSLKLVASADTNATASINTGSTAVHTLSAYVYNGTSGAVGGTVDSTVAQLIYNGVGVGTTYTDTGGGWWRLNYSAAAGSGEQSYGIQVKSGKTIYVDGVQLEQKAYATTYCDGALGDGYSWSGTAHESTSSRQVGDLRYAAVNNIDADRGSLSVWINTDWNSADIISGLRKTVISSNVSGGNYLALYRHESGIWVFHPFTYSSGAHNSTLVTRGRWQHLVITWDGSQAIIYVNSNAGTPSNYTDTSFTPTTLYFSGITGAAAPYANNKKYSDLRIFDTALSSTEVAALYYSGLGSHQIQTGYTEQYTDGEPPTSMWHLDEGSGSNIYDSINSYHGTLGTGDSAPTWASGAVCLSNSCLSFNGTNDYAQVNSTITGLRSLSFWAKPAATSTSIIDLNGSQTVTISNGTIAANGFSSPSIYINGQETTTIAANEWSHVLITSSTSFAASALKLGRAGGSFFNGYLDEIKVFPYVLSADQIKMELNLGKAVSFGHKPETGPVTPLSSKLVAHWKFDEGYGETAHDSSGNNNHGTLGTGDSAPSWTNEGKVGKALEYDGNNRTEIPALITSEKGTISFWFNANEVGNDTLIDFSTGGQYFFIDNQSGNLRFFLEDVGDNDFYSNHFVSDYQAGKWYHIAATWRFNDSPVSQLYLNGELVTQNTSTAGNPATYNTGYLAYTRSNYVTTYAFDGLIDEVKIYNYALSEEEILQDYNQGMAAVMGQSSGNTGSTAPSGSAAQEYCVPGDDSYCAPPVAEWNFEEGSGGTAYDKSGNGNDGTWYGTGNHWGTGKIGKAGVFNGSDDYVTVSDSQELQFDNNFSIGFWVNQAEIDRAQVWLAKRDSGGTNYQCYSGDNNTIRFYDGVSERIFSSNISKNSWTYITYNIDNSDNVSLYVNGKFIETILSSITVDDAPLYIGSWNAGSSPLNGLIDSVKIYNYARTPAQIAWDYNRGGPVGWWKFNECQGTTAYDSSGNGNHGTINIGATAPQTSAGTCTDGSSASAWYNGRSGKWNSSLSFDGVDDYVNMGNNSNFNSSTLAYSFWIKSSNLNIQCLVTKYLDTNNKLQICSNYAGVKQGGTWKQQLSLPSTVFNNYWHHITVNAGTAGVQLYVDGKLLSSDNTNSDLTFLNNQTITVAQMGSGYYFDGQIDDVRIYNYALTDEQVGLIYNNGAAVRF